MKKILVLVILLLSCAAPSTSMIAATMGDAMEYKKVYETTYHYKNVKIVEVSEKGNHYYIVKYDVK